MKIIAVNGSPRKTWNTANLLNSALEGAVSRGAETELVHLYDLSFKGCHSCFACKLKGGKSYGKCATRDDLTPVLERISDADALVLGTPVYLGAASGEMRSFLERLTYPYLVYDAERSTLFPKRMPVGFIYTFGATAERIKEAGYDQQVRLLESILDRIFGPTVSLLVTDTYQFDDYSQYAASAFSVEAKTKRHQEVFPEDCKKAFEMGAGLVK